MNQIFTEIIAKIKDIPLYEAILFLLYLDILNIVWMYNKPYITNLNLF